LLEYKNNKKPWSEYRTPLLEYFIQEGFVSKNQHLFIPRGSMREDIIWEIHNGILSGNFGMVKTQSLVEENNQWLGIAKDF